VLLDQQAGVAGVIGTLGAGIMASGGDLAKVVATDNTTPSLAKNYELLHRFATDGCQLAAMEVSSAGLDQSRVSGLGFDCVIMTNLSQDHLDYHGDMSNYANAKRQLFESNPDAVMVLNIDDGTARSWYQDYQAESLVWAVGRFQSDHQYEHYLFYKDLVCTAQGFDFTLISHLGQFEVQMPLYGEFNVYNLLCALVALICPVGQSPEEATQLLSKLIALVPSLKAVNGRMEQFSAGSKVAIVDYAHTPDALSQALKSLRSHSTGKLWCVFGCGGDRDRTKRPLMAQAAQKYADCIVITNDNPRHEKPQDIAADIQAGLDNTSDVYVEVKLDRKLAIADTLALANDDDIVLIAGKGHETYQVFGDDVIEYDERGFVHQCCVSLTDLLDQ
jgi:UDP-N-acetylmuramoyl-L-alanyl-D-glutamate--2,6-diaminopimelate ligase